MLERLARDYGVSVASVDMSEVVWWQKSMPMHHVSCNLQRALPCMDTDPGSRSLERGLASFRGRAVLNHQSSEK